MKKSAIVDNVCLKKKLNKKLLLEPDSFYLSLKLTLNCPS